MSPRVGTIVALVAAALLAISIATPAWWQGHPSLDGKRFDRKTANVGLITASQCNYADGEETDCKHLVVGGPVAILKFVQLGFTGALAFALIGLAIARERRKGFAKLVMITVAGSAVMSVVMLAIGPSLGTGRSESMPLGYGMFLFFGGTALAIATGAISLLPPRVPRPRPSRPPAPQPSPVPVPQPGFDVEALLGDDALRPAAMSPGGPLAGPGPLIPPSGPHQPLFSSAPQLRPLYEASGIEPPPPAVQFPTRGPTPMPHAAVSAALGLDLPPPPPPTPPKLPPPPSRTKQMSAAPPIPAIPPRLKPTTKPPPIKYPQPTQVSAAVPPPPQRPSELPTSAFARTADADGTSPDARPFDETARPFGEESTTTGEDDDVATSARDKVENPLESEQHTDPEPRPPVRKSGAVPVEDPQKQRAPSKLPISTAQADLPPPRAETGGGGPSPACPQCEAPMAWVEEHLRFYCKSCKMYF